MSEITAAVVMMPCGEDAAKRHVEDRHAHTGFIIGPFFAHYYMSDDESAALVGSGLQKNAWTVTHLATGFAAQKSIPTHSRAIWLAQQLLALHPFDGDSAVSVREAVSELRGAIDTLRADAVSGDCEGSRA